MHLARIGGWVVVAQVAVLQAVVVVGDASDAVGEVAVVVLAVDWVVVDRGGHGVAEPLTEGAGLDVAVEVAVADRATTDAVHVLVDHGVAVVRPLGPADHAATDVLLADVHLHPRHGPVGAVGIEVGVVAAQDRVAVAVGAELVVPVAIAVIGLGTDGVAADPAVRAVVVLEVALGLREPEVVDVVVEPVRVVEELRHDGVAIGARRRQNARVAPAVRERVVEVLGGVVRPLGFVDDGIVVVEVLERRRVVAGGRVAADVDPACREVDVDLRAGVGVVTGVDEAVRLVARPLVLAVDQFAGPGVDERLVVRVARDLRTTRQAVRVPSAEGTVTRSAFTGAASSLSGTARVFSKVAVVAEPDCLRNAGTGCEPEVSDARDGVGRAQGRSRDVPGARRQQTTDRPDASTPVQHDEHRGAVDGEIPLGLAVPQNSRLRRCVRCARARGLRCPAVAAGTAPHFPAGSRGQSRRVRSGRAS